jgi:chromate transport protein ChrA
MILKRIAAIAFALAFLMAIVLFTRIGSEYISVAIAKPLFLTFGAIGLVLNFLSFRFGKHSEEFSFFFWLGTIIVFLGLTFTIMHWPFSMIILLTGFAVLGFSFIYTPPAKKSSSEENDLLDN